MILTVLFYNLLPVNKDLNVFWIQKYLISKQGNISDLELFNEETTIKHLYCLYKKG